MNIILGICNSTSVLEVLRIVKIIITIILIVVPIILLFSLIFKFIGAATKGDEDAIASIKKKAVPSIIAAALIFLVPTIINLIIQISFPNSEYTQCLENSSPEKLTQIYESNAKNGINKVKQTLSKTDYYNAEKSINKLNSDIKDSYLNDLKYLEKYVDMMSDIKQIANTRNRKKYKELSEEVNNITDEDIKNTLLAALEKYEDLFLVYDPIKPNSDENVIKQEETDTLNVYISKFSDYYLTRIWAENPYEQLNKQDAKPYGETRSRPSVLLDNAVKENNLQNKLIVGFNASAFYLKNKYDSASVTYYPPYNLTSVGTIVISNGKVIRNQYEKGDLFTWYITGVDSKNQMVVFEDKRMEETNVTDKKAWSETVINSGIRNTFTFAAPLILEGQKTNYSYKNSHMPESNESKIGLQLICQINDNNFALFTSSNSARNTGIEVFLNLGCKTAVNLDGGGSVALLFKSSTSSSFETIVGNGRSLPEAGYFSE